MCSSPVGIPSALTTKLEGHYYSKLECLLVVTTHLFTYAIFYIFVQLDLNEADRNKSSSILIYLNTIHRIDTEMVGMMPGLIKWN